MLVSQYRDIINDLEIKKKDSAKKDWKKKHTPRVSGRDCLSTHLPRHATLKTAYWAIDADWWRALRKGDRYMEQEYVTGESADDEESDAERERETW